MTGRHRKRRYGGESDGNDSDATVELPPRFDERGRRSGEERDRDPMADKLESVLMSLFSR
jgi:hypothetical protein